MSMNDYSERSFFPFTYVYTLFTFSTRV